MNRLLLNYLFNHTRDWQIVSLFITRKITDRIGLHSFLLPLLITITSIFVKLSHFFAVPRHSLSSAKRIDRNKTKMLI